MTEAIEVVYPSGSNQFKINSWWISAAGDGPQPTMLILRGVAGPMDGYFRIAREVARWGYSVLLHNWQVRGNDPSDEDIQADLEAAFTYLEERSDVDNRRIGLLGFCKGGTFAFFAARQRPALIGIAIFHGFCRRKPSEHLLLQPFQMVKDVRAPMLFLHGTRDSQAPVESMRHLVHLLNEQTANVELHEYEGAEHGFAVSTHPGYEPAAAADSFMRAKAFFESIMLERETSEGQ